MKILILFLVMHNGTPVPEGWPNTGKYYSTAVTCAKAADRATKNPNVASAYCKEYQL